MHNISQQIVSRYLSMDHSEKETQIIEIHILKQVTIYWLIIIEVIFILLLCHKFLS